MMSVLGWKSPIEKRREIENAQVVWLRSGFALPASDNSYSYSNYSIFRSHIIDKHTILDENELGTIEHGKEKSFDVKLNDGSHTIRFTNDENDSVSGSYEIDISSDTTVVFSIECKRDKINVTLISQNEKPDAPQIAAPLSFSDFKSKQLDEAESLLKEAGFKNIRTERLEDLITGLLIYPHHLVKEQDDGDFFMRKSVPAQ